MCASFNPARIKSDQPGAGHNNSQDQRPASRGQDSGPNHGTSFRMGGGGDRGSNNSQPFQPSMKPIDRGTGQSTSFHHGPKSGDRGGNQSQPPSLHSGSKSLGRAVSQGQPTSFQSPVTNIVHARPGIYTDIASGRPNFDEGYEKSDYNNVYHPTPDRISVQQDRRGGKGRGGGGGAPKREREQQSHKVREIIWKMRED